MTLNLTNPFQFKFLEIEIICKEEVSTNLIYNKIKEKASKITSGDKELTIENFLLLSLNTNLFACLRQ
jgi:hypothetical protein